MAWSTLIALEEYFVIPLTLSFENSWYYSDCMLLVSDKSSLKTSYECTPDNLAIKTGELNC